MPNTCPACGAINRDTARFCQNCRQPCPQSVSCPACQALNTATARFCQRCGAGLTAGVPAPIRTAGMLSPGTVLAGRYLILAKIGQGGMGAVYKATDTRLGGKVIAVKELSESGLTGETERLQARQAFEREAALLSQLDHPNLPRVSDHFRDNGRQYLTMDFVDGQTLADVIEATQGPLDAQRVLGWAEQLCAVLEYLHSQQPPIIFRDLKPGNIMVDRNGTVKLIDFGIARHFKAGKASDTTSFGTVGYAPPEQYGKGQTDARSDIYALGATLHHLLTGHDPGDSPFTFPPLRDLNPKVPPAVEKTILKAVQQDPTQRFQNARQMRAALQAPPVSSHSRPTVPQQGSRTYTAAPYAIGSDEWWAKISGSDAGTESQQDIQTHTIGPDIIGSDEWWAKISGIDAGTESQQDIQTHPIGRDVIRSDKCWPRISGSDTTVGAVSTDPVKTVTTPAPAYAVPSLIAQPQPIVTSPIISHPPPSPIGKYEYAPFALRLGALIIDNIIPVSLCPFLFVLISGMVNSSGLGFLLLVILGVPFYFGYHICFLVRSGQTPGKRSLGIRVIAADGGNLRFRAAAVRAGVSLLEVLATFILIGLLGYLWMVWDKDKQSWHDRVAGSYVIRV